MGPESVSAHMEPGSALVARATDTDRAHPLALVKWSETNGASSLPRSRKRNAATRDASAHPSRIHPQLGAGSPDREAAWSNRIAAASHVALDLTLPQVGRLAQW